MDTDKWMKVIDAIMYIVGMLAAVALAVLIAVKYFGA
jgi:hypothetical protein